MSFLEMIRQILTELTKRDKFYQRGCSPNTDDYDTFAEGYSCCLRDLKGLLPVFLLKQTEE